MSWFGFRREAFDGPDEPITVFIPLNVEPEGPECPDCGGEGVEGWDDDWCKRCGGSGGYGVARYEPPPGTVYAHTIAAAPPSGLWPPG
jgi:hypothetical protein